MTGHAKLGPSAAERWMTCPGSVVLSEGMPNKSSKFADEGTLAHALGEACLTEELDAQAFIGSMFEYEDHGATKSELIDVNMANHVMVYVDYVRSLGGKPHYEQRVAVNEQVYGTADAVVWQENNKALHIADLKYGAGVAVEVHGNLQLKIYALATLLTFGYPAKTVTATIVQPRCPHSDGPVRSATYDVVDLLDFHADLLDAIGNVEDARSHSAKVSVRWQDDYLTPSEKGCRWCLASPKCPKMKTMAQVAAKTAFAVGTPYDPKELADILDKLPLLEGWIKNVREFAYAEAEKGHEVPNWKLVEKRATRKWRDEEAVSMRLSEVLHTDDMYERKLITPAAAEKLLPKEQRGLLDELCLKESSGHTLVHESDKRPAIKVDAKSAFAISQS